MDGWARTKAASLEPAWGWLQRARQGSSQLSLIREGGDYRRPGVDGAKWEARHRKARAGKCGCVPFHSFVFPSS